MTATAFKSWASTLAGAAVFKVKIALPLEAFTTVVHLSEVMVDTGVPATPTLALSPLLSPNNDPDPTITVSGATLADTLQFFENGDCTGTPAEEWEVGADQEVISIPTLTAEAAYHYSVKVVDLAANESPCLARSYTYEATARIKLGLGNDHSCAVATDGTAKCWGDNANGQLGRGNQSDIGDDANEMGSNLFAIPLGTVDSSDDTSTALSVHAIAAGNETTCVLLNNGRIKCWGNGFYGQLGRGNTADIGDGANEMGNQLPLLNLGTIDSGDATTAPLTATAVYANRNHICALLSNYRIKCWGSNDNGQLGRGNTATIGDGAREMGNRLPFVNLGTVDPGDATTVPLTVKSVAVGAWHTCALLGNDRAKCWGSNGSGRLGLGNTDDMGDGSGEMGNNLDFIDLGTVDPDDDSSDPLTVKSVASGRWHTCALLGNDRIKCWGDNSNGQLGRGNENDIGDDSGEMGNNLDFIDLGTVDSSDATTAPLTVKSVVTGDWHTCAILGNDRVKCWGDGQYGQVGRGNTADIGDGANEMGNRLPFVNLGTVVDSGDGTTSPLTVRKLALGVHHSCALLSNDQVKCWGLNGSGRLGYGNTNDIGDGSGEMGNNLAPVEL